MYGLSVILALALSGTFLGLESAWADSVIKTINVGNEPRQIAFDSHNGYLYVSNGGDDSVSVIDGKTNTVIDTISVGDSPEGIAFDSNSNRVYVANVNSHTVSVIDDTTNKVEQTISVNAAPVGVGFDPDNNNIYVGTGDFGKFIYVIDGYTNQVIKTIGPTAGTGTVSHILFVPINGYLYAPHDDTLSRKVVTVIDGKTNEIISDITLPPPPTITINSAYDIAFNSDNGHLYVTLPLAGGFILVVDPKTNDPIGDPIPAKSSLDIPSGIVFNPFNGNLYVANVGGTADSNTVSVIDGRTNKIIDTIQVGSRPFNIAYDSDNGNVYVTNVASNTVSVISTTSFIPPQNTVITSATDGNGNLVQDSGSTVSTSITFQVTATPGSNPIAGFECSLDSTQFSTCATNTNPTTISYNNLAAGQQHTFKVRAVDTLGNKDPTPATFTWTILTPQQAVQNIINTIDNMHLSHGITTSLEAPLNAAQSQLNRNNYGAACNTLDAFLHQVKAKEDNGQLTSQQAADLRQQALTIKTSIGCSSTAITMNTATNNNNQESTSTSTTREQQQEQALINLRNQVENNALSSLTK
jgi:YVTN family beta-propeller protein